MTQLLDRLEVIEHFNRAVIVLQSLPDRDKSYFHLKSLWPHYVREFMDVYGRDDTEKKIRHVPTPHEISTYLEVLAWGNQLDHVARKIVFMRAGDFSFEAIGDILDVESESAEIRYKDAIDEIWCAANAQALGEGLQAIAV